MKTTTLWMLSLFLLFSLNRSKLYSQEKKSNITDKIDAHLNNGVINGFSGALLVEQNGEIIINKGYGLANKALKIPNTALAVFDIGSNTKQFTGAAILKLTELNKLKVTDSLYTFFDNLPIDKKSITIHQLLTHTAGFQESLDSDFKLISTEQFIKNVFNSQLYNQPGLKFNYSNLGYSILARIIELVAQMEYEVFLRTNLFEPAGMYQTGYLLPEWKEKNLAVGYNRNILDVGSPVMRYSEDGNVSWHLKGNGGINSTQNDMLLWYRAIKTNMVLSKSSIEKWITPYVSELDDNKHYYGYGWGVRKSDNNELMIYHNGGNGAFSHTIMWKPTEDFVLIYATNTNSPKVENLAYDAEKMIFDKDFAPNKIKKNPYFFVIEFIENNATTKAKKLKELIRNDYIEEFDNPEVLNRLGYMTLRSEKNSDWAIEIFKLNTQLFENEGNVWDSLGDGYVANGEKEEAIKSFKKAIELNNEGTAEKLKKLLQND